MARKAGDKQGSFLYSGKRIYWMLTGKGYRQVLWMRTQGKNPQNMGIVHPSISSFALRQYAGDYLRLLKAGIAN